MVKGKAGDVKKIHYIKQGGLKCPICRKNIMRLRKPFFEGETIWIKDLDFMGAGMPRSFKNIPCPHCKTRWTLDTILTTNTTIVKNKTVDFLIMALVVATIFLCWASR